MLVITGSGRCGTSLLAGYLKELGHDPGGNWDASIHAGYERDNIALLNNLLAELWEDKRDTILPRYSRHISKLAYSVVKEPRFVTLPGVAETWTSCRSDLRFLIALRPFVDAVASSKEAFGNWLGGNLPDQVADIQAKFLRLVHLLQDRGCPYQVVNYPAIVPDFGQLAEALSALGVALPADAEARWRCLAKPAMVHHAADKTTMACPEVSFDRNHPSYAVVGRRYVKALQAAGLRTTDRLLEVGCGSGRIAEALIGAVGSYDGFDCHATAVVAALAHVTQPGFRFRFLDIRNPAYNQRGSLAAEQVTFPYQDGRFDFCCAISVFTHLQEAALRRYLDEARRVLRPGGRLFATCFLIDRSIDPATGRFVASGTGMWTRSPARPEVAVAFDRELLLSWFTAAGFTMRQVERGVWAGPGGNAGYYQDHLLAERDGG